MKRLYSCTLLMAVSVAFLLYPAAASADFLSIPATALFPEHPAIVYSTNGGSLYTTSGDIKNFYAPVFLPYNAIIKSFTLEAYDNSEHPTDGGYVDASLLEFRYNTESIIVTTGTDQQTAPGNIRMPVDVNFQIDNSDYSYGIEVTLYNGETDPQNYVLFYKAIIEYDVPWIVIQGTPPPSP